MDLEERLTFARFILTWQNMFLFIPQARKNKASQPKCAVYDRMDHWISSKNFYDDVDEFSSYSMRARGRRNDICLTFLFEENHGKGFFFVLLNFHIQSADKDVRKGLLFTRACRHRMWINISFNVALITHKHTKNVPKKEQHKKVCNTLSWESGDKMQWRGEKHEMMGSDD